MFFHRTNNHQVTVSVNLRSSVEVITLVYWPTIYKRKMWNGVLSLKHPSQYICLDSRVQFIWTTSSLCFDFCVSNFTLSSPRLPTWMLVNRWRREEIQSGFLQPLPFKKWHNSPQMLPIFLIGNLYSITTKIARDISHIALFMDVTCIIFFCNSDDEIQIQTKLVIL